MAVRGLSTERDEVQRTDDKPAGGPQPVLKVKSQASTVLGAHLLQRY
jgi:hypothetical protein